MSGAMFYAQVAWYYACAAAERLPALAAAVAAAAPFDSWPLYGLLVGPPAAYLCWFAYASCRPRAPAFAASTSSTLSTSSASLTSHTSRASPTHIVIGGVCACRALVHDAERVFSVWPGDVESVLVQGESAAACVADPAAFCAAATAAWGTQWVAVGGGVRVSAPSLAGVSAIVLAATPEHHMAVAGGVLHVPTADDVRALALALDG